MNFEFSESEKIVRASVGGFLKEKATLHSKLKADASEEGFDAGLWSEIAALGWLDAVWGRTGEEIHMLGIIASELGAASLASPFIEHAAAALVLDKSDSAARNGVLDRVLSDSKILALVHPPGESDGFSATTTIDGMLISGGPTLVAWAASAELFVIPLLEPDGASVALVESKSAGVTIRSVKTFDNSRSSFVQFKDVEVGRDRIFSIEPRALKRALDIGDLLIAAEAVGGAFGALDLTTEYVKSRVQFGRPIATFQAVRHGLSDVKALAEGAWLAVWDGLARAANGECLKATPSLASWMAKRAFQEAALKGSQYHGGMGHTRDSHMQFYYRRAGTLHARLDTEWNILGRIASDLVETNFESIGD